MNKSLNVFFAIDKNYVQHFTVALTSLLENNKDLNLSIYVIHDITDLTVFDKTIPFFRDKYGIDLNLVDLSHIDFSNFKTTAQYTKSTYFRLMLAEIIPGHINTGLFLDSDLIINGSIKELVQTDLSEKSIFAVSETAVEDNVNRLNKLGFPVKSYFNAGVILINLTAWRAEKLSQRLVSIAHQHMDKLDWFDQDILNIYFANNWGKLDKKYNAIHLHRKLPVMPVIIHYASYSKPWHYVDTHPYNHLYHRYLSMTPFKKNISQGFSLKNLILKNGRLFKRSLREAGIIPYKHN